MLIEGIFERSDRQVYQHIAAHLPLYGGRPGEELAYWRPRALYRRQ
jgi:hypothetical protein